MEERGYNLRQRPLPVLVSDQSSLPICTIPTAESSVSSGSKQSKQFPTMALSATSSVQIPTLIMLTRTRLAAVGLCIASYHSGFVSTCVLAGHIIMDAARTTLLAVGCCVFITARSAAATTSKTGKIFTRESS